MGKKGGQKKSRERKDAFLWVCKGGVSGGTESTGDTGHMVGAQMDLESKGFGVMGPRASASPEHQVQVPSQVCLLCVHVVSSASCGRL